MITTLTDADIAGIVHEMNGNEPTSQFWKDLARAVIAAHEAKQQGEAVAMLKEASRILGESLRAIGKIKVERQRGMGYFHAEVDWLVNEEQNIVALRRWIEAHPPKAEKVEPNEFQEKAIAICMKSGKVSVSEVQRKLCISYNQAQVLCQSLVDGGFVNGLMLAPSLEAPKAEKAQDFELPEPEGDGK